MLGRPIIAGVPLREMLPLGAIIAVATALRFIGLPARGQWEADQGHDMLVLFNLTQHGEWPLLGPPTSIGDFHHGVLYYYLLAPAAWLSGANPVAVTAMIALAGIAAVIVTWRLARSIGGPVAGLVAGGLMAVSASAVDESVFIWNPNLIALTSSIALAAGWHGWSAGGDGPARPLAWVVAFAGAVATMHCHVLGVILSPAIVAPWLLDLRRRDAADRRGLLLAGLAGLGILLLSYVPLAINLVTTDFAEVRAAVAFVTGGGEPATMSLPVRAVVISVRILSWPLTGLVTGAPIAALVIAAAVVAALVWRALAGAPPERFAARWFGLTLVWTATALSVAASGLATVVPRLPNDHYHAFVDPIVFVSVGLGIAALARLPMARPALGAAVAAAAAIALAAFNLIHQPPAISPDGGWPGGDVAAVRVLDDVGGADAGTLVLHGLPEFKSADAMRFPLVRRGADAPQTWSDSTGWETLPHVVLCDALFEESIGAACNGPAEDAAVAPYGQRLVERFESAPDRWVSVYLPD
ncbi:MAG: ArnT family glycosyltransferase [Chloroflexota bacterium]